MFTLPKAIYRFNEIPTKIPMAFSQINRTNNPKMYMEPQKQKNTKNQKKHQIAKVSRERRKKLEA